MSKGKKVKINFKSNAESEAERETKEMSEEQNPEQSKADIESQPGSESADLMSNLQEQGPRNTENSLAEDRLNEFLARDVDFTGLEAAEIKQDEVSKLKDELREANDRYLRAIADLENFRKHSLKERSDLLKYQGEKVILDLLEVIDNFELAIQHKDAEVESLRTGLELIHKQMLDVLERWGVKAESSLGAAFDPNKHNAINKVPSADVAPGSIVAELKKPYVYKDKLLRVGQVVVAEAPSGPELKTE